MNQTLERLVDLVPENAHRLYNLTIAEARERILSGLPEAVLGIEGSFALVAKAGRTVRMARSLDRPMRYFLAKRQEGPALVVAQRIDAIAAWLGSEGLSDQFHPSYTRMVPAHHVVEIRLVGCPDPDPTFTRFFAPKRNGLPADLDEIGSRYIGALAEEIARWLRSIPEREPVGVCFSGGIDSGAVFLTTYHVMKKLGMNPARLKAFTLSLGDGPDLGQAVDFLERLDLGMFLEAIEANGSVLDAAETIRVVEDYKPLDIECASMSLALCRGIRERYPDWRFLVDGDGGDENLKDYPIEENPELTIRSVLNNTMLYQEGWGVGTIKHSPVYTGGLSRSFTRNHGTVSHCGFEGFSPFTRPSVIEVAEQVPFVKLTDYDVSRLYALKGEVVSRGVKSVTGFEMPVFPKRRFQHGALSEAGLRRHLPHREREYRRLFLAIYA
ncbi:MAG TPA: asparagine synthase-related protein [Methylomirabilota bacterium]|nr:asparagine synthase-related protein [Methylomirabilota bacterium]